MKIFLHLLNFLLFFKVTFEVMISLSKDKEFCVYKDIYSEDSLWFSYEVSGIEESEEGVSCKILDHKGNIYYSNEKKESPGTFLSKDKVESKTQGATEFKVCFLTTKSYANLSFEIYSQSESGHLVDLLKGGKIDDVHKNVTTISSLFQEIETNMKFVLERKDVHSRIISDIIESIKILTIAKIISILIIVLIQIFFIKKILNKSKVIKIGNNETENNPFKNETGL
jgi:hypothetical protein